MPQFVVTMGGEIESKHATEPEAMTAGARLAQTGVRVRVIEVPAGYLHHPSERTLAHWYQGVRVQLETLDDAARRIAEEDAEAFVEEFPGQQIVGEWDAEAWEAHSRAHVRGVVERPLTSEEESVAWGIYRTRLIEKIEELRAGTAGHNFNEDGECRRCGKYAHDDEGLSSLGYARGETPTWCNGSPWPPPACKKS